MAAPGPSTAPASTPSAPTTEVPTLLSTLHTLLRAHIASHPSPTPPYLHPYAPLPPAAWKGKARAVASPDALKAMREAVEGARGVLAKRDDKERVRLARAMREVITHESNLLPLGTTLASLPPATRPLGSIAMLPPAELLSALGKRLDLQVFAEDSQFGMLRTSLTLAGKRFVVDVDLEADTLADEGSDPPTAAASPGNGATPVPLTPIASLGSLGMSSLPTPGGERERGVRLAKLSANHVTPAGEDGKTDSVARALRVVLLAHIAAWNGKDADSAEREAKLRASAAKLENALAELKTLDELAEAGGADAPDLFADLERLDAGIATAVAEGIVFDPHGMLPAFRLLPGPGGVRNPAFRLRPVGKGENVPPPPEEGDGSTGDDAMAVDSVSKENDPMSAGSWLLEYVDDGAPSPSGRGLTVRRTWLLAEPHEESEASTWSASVKVEGLLYQTMLGGDAIALFPHGSDFVHRPTDGLVQHWSLAHAGPEGYVVGRVGLPPNWTGFSKLVSSLRTQLVLNVLLMSAFSPDARVEDSGESGHADGTDADGDADMEGDALDGARTAIPLTVNQQQRAIRLSLAFDEGPVVLLLQPSQTPPYWTAACDGDAAAQVEAALQGLTEPDAVEIARRVERALEKQS